MSKPKLALIPSGYKSGKVYSILPNDASGDFDFTRQSIGTRVRKDGLIEEAKTVGSITNELLYSEDYSQSQWSKIRSTISTDQTLAPDGTNTADKIIPTVDNNTHRCDQVITLTNSAVYTLSFYAKEGGYNCIRASIGQTGLSFGSLASFNLNTETVSITGTVRDAQIKSIANDWYRCSITMDTGTTDRIVIGIGNNDSYSFSGDTTSGVFMWGAMVSEGALSDYIKTEGSQETKRVETFTDVPRLDWLNSNCPSLLLEPQRTNLFGYSEEYDQPSTYWTKTRFTISADAIISTNGTLTADEVFETVDNNNRFLYQNISVTSGNDYTISFFVKYNNIQYLQLTGSTGFDLTYVNFDILNGEIVRNLDNADARIEDFGNDWLRISLTLQATSTAIGRIILCSIPTSTSSRAAGYIGNTSNSFYLWGGQMEQGSYPTSYIKTEASAVTRLKDDLQDLNNVDLINSVEGVFYAEIRAFKSETVFKFITLNDGTSSNTVRIYLYNRIYARLLVGGVEQCIFNTTDYDVTEFNKIAFLYSPDNFKLFVNGVLIGSDTSGSTFANETLTTLSFDRGDNAFRFDGAVKDLRVYNTTLTDNELIELTK